MNESLLLLISASSDVHGIRSITLSNLFGKKEPRGWNWLQLVFLVASCLDDCWFWIFDYFNSGGEGMHISSSIVYGLLSISKTIS